MNYAHEISPSNKDNHPVQEYFLGIQKAFEERLLRAEVKFLAHSKEMQEQVNKLTKQLSEAEKKNQVKTDELITKNKDFNDQLLKVTALEERISKVQSQLEIWGLKYELNKSQNDVKCFEIKTLEKHMDNLNDQIVKLEKNFNQLEFKLKEIKKNSLEYDYNLKDLLKKLNNLENKQGSFEELILQDNKKLNQELLKGFENLQLEQNNLKMTGSRFFDCCKAKSKNFDYWSQKLFKELVPKVDIINNEVTQMSNKILDLIEQNRFHDSELYNCVRCLFQLNFGKALTEKNWGRIVKKELFNASDFGRQDFTQFYLYLGADVSRSFEGEIRSNPLHHAARNGHLAVVAELIKHGGNVDVTNINGCTPLHEAARYGHLAVVNQLIHHGANVNIKEIHGLTPLHLATFWQHDSVLAKLLECGAVNSEDNTRQSPMDTAKKIGRNDFVQIFKNYFY